MSTSLARSRQSPRSSRRFVVRVTIRGWLTRNISGKCGQSRGCNQGQGGGCAGKVHLFYSEHGGCRIVQQGDGVRSSGNHHIHLRIHEYLSVKRAGCHGHVRSGPVLPFLSCEAQYDRISARRATSQWYVCVFEPLHYVRVSTPEDNSFAIVLELQDSKAPSVKPGKARPTNPLYLTAF